MMSTSDKGAAPRPRPSSGHSLAALRGQDAAIGSFESKEIAKQSSQIRRFYFAVNASGEILSSLDKSSKQYVTPRVPASNAPQTLRKAQSSKDVYRNPLQAEPTFMSETPSRDFATPRVIPVDSQDIFRRTQSSNEGSKASPNIPLPAIGTVQESPSKYMRGRQSRTVLDSVPAERLGAPSPAPPVDSKICYYSVILAEEEANGPTIDYSQDHRRFAYRDFAFAPARPEGGLRPQALLKWVLAARPRNQDDVVPIMQLCKGVLRDLMEERIVCEQTSHDALQRQIADLRRGADERAASEQRLAAQLADTREQLLLAQEAVQRLERDAELLKAQHTEQLERERAEQRELLRRAHAEHAAACADQEKRARAAEMVAEHRTRDFYKAHGALATRMQMKPREVVASWSVDDQFDALRSILQQHQRSVELLRAADFQALPPALRRDLTRKLLEAARAASASWLGAVAELFEAPVGEFYRRVAGWYAQEGIVTDDVRYHEQVETFKGVIEGTDLTPLYTVFREGVVAGKYSVYELVFNCSGKSPEETMLSMTSMSLEEVAIFKEHRDSILRFVQTRRSVVAREREESVLKKGLGFLHHNVGRHQVAEPMEVAPMYGLVAKLFSRKIAADLRRADGGREPPVNIMRVTRVLLGAPSAGPSSEAGLRIAQLVKGVQVSGPACPRLHVFGILAGMDDKSPWLERACAFAMAFITGVVEGLWEDPDLLSDFARRNFLARPDLDEDPELDRIEWTLTDHDIKLPVTLLLKSAMNACELHPCGCGYPRDQIQRIMDASCGPPADYVELQNSRIQEARKRLKRMRAQARQRAEDMRLEVLFDRLSKGEKNIPAADPDGIEQSPPKPDLESLRTQQAELNRLLISIQNMSASLDPKPSKSEDRPKVANIKITDCGASFENGAKGWFDVFFKELLQNWFRQNEVLEAQMIRIFDEFDLDGNGSLSLDEFTQMIDKSPVRSKYSVKQILKIYSELTSQEGILTKRDWLSLFRYVEFDILAVIRPRRDSIRKLLVEKHWQKDGRDKEDHKVTDMRIMAEATIQRVSDDEEEENSLDFSTTETG